MTRFNSSGLPTACLFTLIGSLVRFWSLAKVKSNILHNDSYLSILCRTKPFMTLGHVGGTSHDTFCFAQIALHFVQKWCLYFLLCIESKNVTFCSFVILGLHKFLLTLYKGGATPATLRQNKIYCITRRRNVKHDWLLPGLFCVFTGWESLFT